MRRRLLVLLVLLASLLGAPTAVAANPQIAGLQVALRAHGLYRGPVDGVAGPATARAVRRFQHRAGLTVDGLAGPRTRAALGRLGRPLFGRRPLRIGMVGWDVAVLQFLLGRKGFPSGTVDGRLGTGTAAALSRYQRSRGLLADGVAGRLTLASLCSSRACPRLPRRARARPIQRYVVHWGDTLTAIAARHRASIRAIARANRLDPRRVLRAGTALRIPLGVSATPLALARRAAVRSSIDRWAGHYGVDAHLARALAWMESGYQVDLVSANGAWGVMQITRPTWDFVELVLLGRNVPRTADGNVRIGVAYLRHLLRAFGGNERLALAGYYQGARAVRRRGVLPETRAYVADILALKTRL